MGCVPQEPPYERCAWWDYRLFPQHLEGRVDSGNKTCPHGGTVTLGAGDLTSRENAGPAPVLKGIREDPRRPDIGISMDAAEPQEASVFQSRQFPKKPLLLSMLEPRLETDHAVHSAVNSRGCLVSTGIGLLGGPWSGNPDRFHTSVCKCVVAHFRLLFYRHAGREEPALFKAVRRNLLGGSKALNKLHIPIATQRNIEIGRLTLSVPG